MDGVFGGRACKQAGKAKGISEEFEKTGNVLQGELGTLLGRTIVTTLSQEFSIIQALDRDFLGDNVVLDNLDA